MRYINHKSDFQVIINIKDKEGNIIAPPSVPWEAVFSDENGVEFKCYYDGNNYTHCIVDFSDIVCFVDNPGFACGKLRCTFHQHVPSEEYCDGVMDLSQPLQCDIMLSKRESDDSTPITIEASPNWVRGPQGEQGIQGPQGIKGDKGDKGDTGAKGDRGEKGDQGERGLQGVQGVKGDDGVSPTVTTSKTGKVTTIEITDANGVHTATVNDGESVEVVQSTGTSTTSVMSQKAVSDALSNVYTKAESDARYLRGGFEYCGLMEWDGTNEVKIYEMQFDSPKREVFIYGLCTWDKSNKGQFKIIITHEKYPSDHYGISHFNSSSNAEECFHIHNVCGNYVCDINSSNNHLLPNELRRCYMRNLLTDQNHEDVGLITNLKIEITTDLVRVDGVQKWFVFAKN